MQRCVTSIRVEQLGGLFLDRLSPGLNVIYGPNGSGKTTLLRFVRSLMAAIRGEGDLNDGPCDGIVGLDAGVPLTLIGQRRPNRAATLAIRCTGDDFQPIDQFRQWICGLSHELLNSLFLVDPLNQGHMSDITSILSHLAHADADDASPARARAWQQDVRRLQQECENLQLGLAMAERSLARTERATNAERRWIERQLAALTRELERLDLDHQSAVMELREAEDRLWSVPKCRAGGELRAGDCEDSLVFREMLEVLAHRRHDLSLKAIAELSNPSRDWLQERKRIDECERALLGLWQQPASCGRASPPRQQVSLTELQNRVALLKASLTALAPQLRAARSDFHSAVERHEWELGRRERQIRALKATLAATRQRLAELPSEAPIRAPQLPRVLSAASDFVRCLTLGRYDCLQWNDADGDVCLKCGDDVCAVRTLSRGTLEQVALAVRLAAADVAGQSAPMIWDEVLADCDEARTAAACQLLAESAANQQIIILTCRARIAALLTRHGAALQTIGGAHLPEFEVDDSQSVPSAVARQRYWLEPDSPLAQVPSLSRQMIRFLAGQNVRSAGDLLLVDLTMSVASTSDPVVSLERLCTAQAEARLLLSVPNLTARDAQLLAACGITTSDQLIACRIDDLISRIDQVRSVNPGAEVAERWPLRSDVESWIGMGRAGRNVELLNGRQHHRGESASPLHDDSAAVEDFRLRRDAPVVEAPAIGLASARRLARLGIQTVSDLMAADPALLAQRMKNATLSADRILRCQQQCRLMCAIPDLSAWESRAMVECGITRPQDLQRISASALYGMLRERRRNGCEQISLERVAQWIAAAEQLGLRAA